MSKSVANALKAMGVLTAIAVVCVAVLALCYKFFPKYEPKLDAETAGLINSICKAEESADAALENKSIVLLNQSEYGVTLADYNKEHKSSKATILAVYGEPKGLNPGAYIIECSAEGRDSDVVILVAYRDGVIVGAVVKKQNESYWHKLPETLFDGLNGKSGEVDLVADIGKTGATVSLSAVNRAVNLSDEFAAKYEKDICAAIQGYAEEGGNE